MSFKLKCRNVGFRQNGRVISPHTNQFSLCLTFKTNTNPHFVLDRIN